MMPLMLIVVALLASAAVVAGRVLAGRLAGDDLATWTAGRGRWRTATRGRLAARRRRDEAALVSRLTHRAMTRADYHLAMSYLAAEDESRCPIAVPKLHAE